MHLNMSPAKLLIFCLGLNVLWYITLAFSSLVTLQRHNCMYRPLKLNNEDVTIYNTTGSHVLIGIDHAYLPNSIMYRAMYTKLCLAGPLLFCGIESYKNYIIPFCWFDTTWNRIKNFPNMFGWYGISLQLLILSTDFSQCPDSLLSNLMALTHLSGHKWIEC